MPTYTISVPEDFSYKHTVYGHGWCDLAPFSLDETAWTLNYVFPAGKAAVPVTISGHDGKVKIKAAAGDLDKKAIVHGVRHILRLDESLADFYDLAKTNAPLAWAAEARAGRLLRSPTVFEDLVKTLCTTNCSWALTKKMVTNIVEKLGNEGPDGSRSFPDAETMAAQSPDFYREEIRAGYRSPYFVEMAEKVASGEIDPESWLTTDMPTPELKKEIKTIKGFGDYAADNLLKLIGRYDGLALDSWLRAQFYKKRNNEKKCPDKKIERHYALFGPWKGLAIWCDMTERWFDGKI
jgi:N-glycosylase/DNA lyase